ncbi:MAG: hypothetical protein FWD44_04435 [Oscillospiraceae bacterium]|nr:hypothetical protein [Oscillospiraceae bacterium]
MENPKFKNPLAAISLIILVIFSIIVFPFLLAATPENRKIETIEPETTLTADKPLGSVNPDGTTFLPDINAIPKETVIERFEELFIHNGGTTYYENSDDAQRVLTQEFRSARYVTAADYMDFPRWQILYYESGNGRLLFRIPEHISAEAYLKSWEHDIVDKCCNYVELGSFVDGSPALVVTYKNEYIGVVDFNAYTGELTHTYVIELCNHYDKFGTYSYDDATDWALAKETIAREGRIERESMLREKAQEHDRSHEEIPLTPVPPPVP